MGKSEAMKGVNVMGDMGREGEGVSPGSLGECEVTGTTVERGRGGGSYYCCCHLHRQSRTRLTPATHTTQ